MLYLLVQACAVLGDPCEVKMDPLILSLISMISLFWGFCIHLAMSFDQQLQY